MWIAVYIVVYGLWSMIYIQDVGGVKHRSYIHEFVTESHITTPPIVPPSAYCRSGISPALPQSSPLKQFWSSLDQKERNKDIRKE